MCAQMQQRGRWALLVVGASCVQAAAIVNSHEYLNTSWPCLGHTFTTTPVWLRVAHTQNGAPVYVTEGTPNDNSYHYLYEDPDCDGRDGNDGFSAWIMSTNPPDTCALSDIDSDGVCTGHALLGTGAKTVPMNSMWRVFCCDPQADTSCQMQLNFVRFSAIPASTPGLPTISDFPALSLPHTCPTTTETTTITSSSTVTDTSVTSRTTITGTLTLTTTHFTGTTIVTSTTEFTTTETTTSFRLDFVTLTSTTMADVNGTISGDLNEAGAQANTGVVVGALILMMLVGICCCGCVYVRQMRKSKAGHSDYDSGKSLATSSNTPAEAAQGQVVDVI